jgi:hypothetical protein
MSTALVIGSSDAVWAEVERACDMAPFDGVVACNMAGVFWGGELDAWCTLHGDMFNPWTEGRRRRGFPPAHRMFTEADNDWKLPNQRDCGSSGLFALKVALIDLGFDRAVLCGIPLSMSGKHFNDAALWHDAITYRDAWQQVHDFIAPRARSMSGWTAGLIGKPNAEWIAGED